jgi:hypothetical protein
VDDSHRRAFAVASMVATMSRLAPEHFNPVGRPKRAFAKQKDCTQYLRDNDWVGLFGFYKCSWCDQWHLTARKGKSKGEATRRFG